MKTAKIIFLLIFQLCNLNAQNISLQWSNSFGGSEDESPGSIVKDNYSSGYYVIGYESSGDGDVSFHFGAISSPNLWIIKIDSIGSKILEKSFGGSSGEKGLKIFQLADGSFILTGTAGSVDGDVIGNHPRLGNPASGTDDYWILKIDSSLNIQWQRCLGGSDFDYLKDAIVTSDGGYLLFGDIWSNDGDISGFHGGDDYWVVKLDSVGNILWQKCLGSGAYDDGISCIELPDSNYLLAGGSQTYFAGYHGGTDIGIVKLSKTGTILSQKSYGGSNIDVPRKIISTLNGGFYVVGITNSNDGDVTNFMGYYDIWIFKADSNGNIIWQKCYGGGGIDFSYDAKLTPEGGLLFTGHSNSNDSLYVIGTHGEYDIWVAKIDSMGSLQWGKSLGGSLDDIGVSILQTDANNYVLAAEIKSSNDDIIFNHGGKDIWIAKLTDNGTSINESVRDNNYFNTSFQNGILSVSFFETHMKTMDFSVFDILGKVKFRKQIKTQVGLNQFAFPLTNWDGPKVISLGQYKKIIY